MLVGEGSTKLSRRLRLGDAVEDAVASLEDELGADAKSLSLMVAIHNASGGDLATMIERLAEAIDVRARNVAAARTAGAGAVLSARIVAGLPLLCIPLLPLSHAPLLDPLGLAMLAVGALLAVAGLRWIARLVPVPPGSDDPVATIAEVVGSVLEAGIGLRPALDGVARLAPQESSQSFEAARRRVALGMTWPEAFLFSGDEELCAFARTLQIAQHLGVPIAPALANFAAGLRRRRVLEFEERTRKAPVMMVLPLVLCGLPSFLLLSLGPFIRGLSIS
jgi:tight adherence protein B